MSELIDARASSRDLRWTLLTTVSTLALLGFVCGNAKASESDADRPTVWIELGGQLEHVTGDGEPFAPTFLAANANAPVIMSASPLQAQKAPFFFEHGGEGKFAFEPEGSDWVFSAAIRYGRSNRDEHTHKQSHVTFPNYTFPPDRNDYEENYADTVVKQNGSHTVVDFSAGKDIGLGIFGAHGTSTLSAGVRFAQFSSDTTTVIMARPTIQRTGFLLDALKFHEYYLDGAAARSFRGVGPSLSWNASTKLVGDPSAAEVALDFGANGAVLFGRQKAKVSHHTTAMYHHKKYPYVQTYSKNGHRTNARSVVAPNVGGFAAISVRRADVIVNFGYRADFFFGAIDGGIDAKNSSTLGFSGPYATIDIGIGG